MKKYLKKLWAASLILVLGISCSKNSSSGSVTPIITSGTFRVTLFSERGIDETTDFSGYVFTFQSSGVLQAEKSGVVKTGSWSEDKSSGKLLINLGPKDNTNKPLGQLTDDWFIIGKTDSKINLTDDNAARNELVEFTRN